MLCTAVNLQLAVDCAAETIVRDHSLDGALNEKLWTARAALTESFGFVTADETGEAHVGLLGLFLAADLNVCRIDDNDKIAGVRDTSSARQSVTISAGTSAGDMRDAWRHNSAASGWWSVPKSR